MPNTMVLGEKSRSLRIDLSPSSNSFHIHPHLTNLNFDIYLSELSNSIPAVQLSHPALLQQTIQHLLTTSTVFTKRSYNHNFPPLINANKFLFPFSSFHTHPLLPITSSPVPLTKSLNVFSSPTFAINLFPVSFILPTMNPISGSLVRENCTVYVWKIG